tara:strand:- start:196 stop:597 length:402 start_codon:yes stop_codon:yes gene_type:complete
MDIVNAMNMNMFNTSDIDPVIKNEVVFFKNILIQNLNNSEVFHGYVNKINTTWNIILSDSFKSLVDNYNQEYAYKQLQQLEKEKRMVSVANEYILDNLDLDSASISSEGDLTNMFKKSAISKKKRPSRRLTKK